MVTQSFADSQVTVTEKIPWATCEDAPGGGTSIETRRYICDVPEGFGGVLAVLKGFLQWLSFIAVLVGILMIVASGVQMSISGVEPSAKEAAKKRISQVIQGFVLLFAVGFILSTIAPWIYN